MTDSQKWLTFVFLLVTGWLIYLLSPVLMPFALAAILAYLGDPLADKLEMVKVKRFQLSRTYAVIVVFTAMLLIVTAIAIILVPIIEAQVGHLIRNFPVYSQWLNEAIIPWLDRELGLKVSLIESDKLLAIIKTHWQKTGESALTFMGSVSRSGALLAAWMMNLVLIPVITFYLLRDWDDLVIKVHDLLPRRLAPTAAKLAAETDVVLAAFMRGQFYVMLALGVIYSLGLWLVGLKLALLIGMMAGLVSFVPYLGSIVGIVVACIAALLQFHQPIYLIPVSIVFIVGQSIEGMVLTPLLVGDRVGLHPVAVMFAVLAGGQLFGFLGILLALPVASVIMVLLRHIHEIYRDSSFYNLEH